VTGGGTQMLGFAALEDNPGEENVGAPTFKVLL
jgi:hypothetical protein